VTMSFPESLDAFREWLEDNYWRLVSQENVIALPMDLADHALDFLHSNHGVFVPSGVRSGGRFAIFDGLYGSAPFSRLLFYRACWSSC
jgi:hypothetical protein